MKIKKLHIINLIIVIIIIFSCNIPQKKQSADSVVIYFKDYNPASFQTPAGMGHTALSKVAYIDNGILKEFTPDIYADTLILSCPEDFKEIMLSYRNFENHYFSILKGDTVMITLDSLDFPQLHSKNYPERDRLYNLNANVRKNKTHLSLEAKTCLGEGMFIHIANNIDYVREQKMRFALDYCPIDSLQMMYDNYKIAYRDSIEQFKKEKLITEELYNHLNNILYLKEIEADRELKKDTTLYHQLEIGINDKYIHYASYHEYLNHYLWNFNHHVKDITHIQGSYNDWKQTFDELSRKNFQLKSLQLLLANCIRNIGENFNVNELNEYLEKYITITKDSTLHHELYCEYNLSANANQLLLEDNLNKRSNFEELLKELKGKVIYIDFWASWCASCKAEMEPSAKLRHEFKDKDIAFVYLAYNDKKDNWRASLEKQKLSNQPYSFFILNSKNSKLLQELKVNLIPRFIIIDKQGNIVNANAPRPGSTDIVNILKQYL